MRVRATKTGFYNGSRRRVGAEFALLKPEHFSKNWMEKIGEPKKPEGKEPKKPE